MPHPTFAEYVRARAGAQVTDEELRRLRVEFLNSYSSYIRERSGAQISDQELQRLREGHLSSAPAPQLVPPEPTPQPTRPAPEGHRWAFLPVNGEQRPFLVPEGPAGEGLIAEYVTRYQQDQGIPTEADRVRRVSAREPTVRELSGADAAEPAVTIVRDSADGRAQMRTRVPPERADERAAVEMQLAVEDEQRRRRAAEAARQPVQVIRVEPVGGQYQRSEAVVPAAQADRRMESFRRGFEQDRQEAKEPPPGYRYEYKEVNGRKVPMLVRNVAPQRAPVPENKPPPRPLVPAAAERRDRLDDDEIDELKRIFDEQSRAREAHASKAKTRGRV